MTTLLRLPPQPEEPLPTFLSRMAALNGCPSLRLFLEHLRIGYGDVVKGREAAFAATKQWFSVGTETLRANSIHRNDDGVYLQGQTLARHTLRREHLCVCPDCLLEDIAADGPPEGLAYCRASWLLAPIRTCAKHNRVLCKIPRDPKHDVHDFSVRVETFLKEQIFKIKTKARQTSDLEEYVSARLSGRKPKSEWLDTFPLYAAVRACEVIGAVSRHGPNVMLDDLTDDEWCQAGQAGYAFAKDGIDGVNRYLEGLKSTFLAARRTWGPRYTYGRLYEWLAHETEDPVYEPLRQMIRDFTIANFPVGPGELLLGHPVKARVIHSIRSASLETGLHPKRLRKQVHAAGLVSKADLRLPDDRVLFPVAESTSLLNSLSDALKLKEVGPYLNIPRAQLIALDKAGILQPSLSMETGNGRAGAYSRRMLDAFLARLLDGSEAVAACTGTRATIPTAAKRACCSAGEIVKLIQGERLAWKGRLPGVEGYLSVLVDYDEVRRLVKGEDHGGVTLRQAEKLLGVSTAVLLALIDHGHLSSETVINPVNRCPQRIIRQDDLDAFNRDFIGLTRLGAELRVYLGDLRRRLDAASISPAINAKDVGARFYRRSDIFNPSCTLAIND
ncbi:TniQ family protein [Dongia sp.]|uniref:TniQ family protein n=1 Tax=Dongia sp. TaxID=1977262 RepID=UPI0035AEC9ED